MFSHIERDYQITLFPSDDKAHPFLQLTIKSNNLSFLGAGSNHLVLENNEHPGQVLIFKLFSQEYSKDENKIFDIMEQAQQSILRNFFPIVHNYRWKKTKMYIKDLGNQETNQFFKFLEKRFAQKYQEEKQSSNAQSKLRIDKEYHYVELSSNIFKSEKFDTFVEFKIKSVLPNLFSERMIVEASNEMKIEVDQIKKLLKNGEPIQKNRWFIKNMEKIFMKSSNKPEKSKKQNRIHENPLQIFCVGPQAQQVPNFVKTKLFKNIPSLSQDQQRVLNSTIFQYIQSHRELIESVHQVQSMFPYSPDFINTKLNIDLIKGCKDLPQIIKKLEDKIRLLYKQGWVSLIDTYQNLINCTCVSQQPRTLQSSVTEEDIQYQKMSKFLVYLMTITWKDISFVFRSKFNGHSFDDSQLFIIDDYLKNYGDVKYNIRKDQRLLKKIIKYQLMKKDIEKCQN